MGHFSRFAMLCLLWAASLTAAMAGDLAKPPRRSLDAVPEPLTSVVVGCGMVIASAVTATRWGRKS